MKIFLMYFIMTISSCIRANAQSDTLVITKKNSIIERYSVSQIQKIIFENITDVLEHQFINKSLLLTGNYPNPFAEMTNIDFEISSAGNFEVIIFDNSGRQIQILKCENCSSGKNSLLWDGFDLKKNKVQSGIYYYEVCSKNEILSKQMILAK